MKKFFVIALMVMFLGSVLNIYAATFTRYKLISIKIPGEYEKISDNHWRCYGKKDVCFVDYIKIPIQENGGYMMTKVQRAVIAESDAMIDVGHSTSNNNNGNVTDYIFEIKPTTESVTPEEAWEWILAVPFEVED